MVSTVRGCDKLVWSHTEYCRSECREKPVVSSLPDVPRNVTLLALEPA